MVLQFYIGYKTKFGEKIFLVSKELEKITGSDEMLMHYESDDHWSLSIDLPQKYSKTIYYYYLVQNLEGFKIYDGEINRFILSKDLNKGADHCNITDTWIGTNNQKNIFYTSPFNGYQPKNETRLPKDFTHIFKVKAPLLREEETICLLGSTPNLNQWDETNPIIMKYIDGWYIARISMNENEWPVSYKYAIYNQDTKEITQWEAGENRQIKDWNTGGDLSVINDGYVAIDTPAIKQAGVNVPVFSLRSKTDFGVGEFLNIKLLVDWCAKTGLKVIQLLPVNDTTETGNWEDSYPYAPVSAFALHPLYINLDKVAGKAQASLIKKLAKKKKQLNQQSAVDYDQVMEFKLGTLKELFGLQKEALKKDRKFLKFVKDNKEWLQPYAAFCYLREKNGTANFSEWKDYSEYKSTSISRLTGSGRKEYDQILFHYYVQYHLHSQLKEASDYAHKKGIALKGDLPIGLHRNACDVWMYPELFNTGLSAGAPPDFFTQNGQNWGFPIYNWEAMKATDYEWWKKRLAHLSNYFDAYRVDHILGFFRIWSIPTEQINGILGHFVPSIPIYREEFGKDKIFFEQDRLCQPYITDEIINDIFGVQSDIVIKKFLTKNEDGIYHLNEGLDTERNIAAYLSKKDLKEYQEGLFKLLSNVVLMEEKGSDGQHFHFRYDAPNTSSFKNLDHYLQDQLRWLYHNYFFDRQDSLWTKNAMEKLPVLQRSSGMLMCAEDLGWVPDSVPRVMSYLDIPGLKSQRISPDIGSEFFDLKQSPYLSITQPGTHDMETLRAWWEQDPAKTKRFAAQFLNLKDEDIPATFTVEVGKKVISQYLQSPSFWAIFLLQDILSITEKGRTERPADERINIPSEPHHYWRYRMNSYLEDLIKDKDLNHTIQQMLEESNRL